MMDTHGLMPSTYFYKIGAQMRQKTDIPGMTSMTPCQTDRVIFCIHGRNISYPGKSLLELLWTIGLPPYHVLHRTSLALL